MHTLISAFEDRTAAERAAARLHELGFAPDDVSLQEYRDAAGGKGDFDADRGLASSYGHAFASMFGIDGDHHDVAHYASAHRSGHPLLVVSAEDDDRADIAADALQGTGAIDVHQRAGVAPPAEDKQRGVLRVSRERA